MAPVSFAKKGNDEEKMAENTQPRSPKISPRRLIAAIFITLITLNLLQRPLTHCFHRMSQHFCHQSHLSVEDRAHKVLSSTPLIGETDASSSSHPHTNTNRN